MWPTPMGRPQTVQELSKRNVLSHVTAVGFMVSTQTVQSSKKLARRTGTLSWWWKLGSPGLGLRHNAIRNGTCKVTPTPEATAQDEGYEFKANDHQRNAHARLSVSRIRCCPSTGSMWQATHLCTSRLPTNSRIRSMDLLHPSKSIFL